MQSYQHTGGSGSQRPFSVNNPFRNASQTLQDSSLKQYETDEDFQNEDDILNHYESESSKENTYQGINNNRLDFARPPSGFYRYVLQT